MRTLQRFGVGVALVLVALGGAGLASAGDEEVTLQLVARGGRFVPERLVAPAGKIVRIEIANEGTRPSSSRAAHCTRRRCWPRVGARSS